MTKVKVTLDGSVLGWGSGGIARYLRNVLAHLGEDPNLCIELLANSRTPVAGIRGVNELDRRLKGGALWRSTVLAAHLWRHRPDVYWLPTTAALPAPSPHPYVVTVHDLAPALMARSKPPLETIAFRTAYRRAVLRADHVLAVSDATAHDLRTVWSVPEARITVAPLGVADTFCTGDPVESRRRVGHRWEVEHPIALVVGTVEERKGLDLAVDVAQAAPELTVVFVGRMGYGHERVHSRGLAAGARFVGEVSDSELVDLYRAAEVLLVPSLYEGFGLTALEAMACGCPVVVAGNAGSLGSLFGGAAKVVDNRAVGDWLTSIEEVRSDRQRWAAAGPELAGRYTWRATAEKTAQVLKKVARVGHGSVA